MGDNPKLRIVVVGGGGAGANVVRSFGKKLNPLKHELILITTRTRFAYLPAALRLLVSRDTPLETVFMSYDKVFDNFPGQLKVGKATSVQTNLGGSGGKVLLESGEEVLYDVLVIATGSSWEGLVDFPDDETLYKEFIEEWRNKFEHAKNVVIVGGGAVGIETAGEIKDVYPDKPVTIVQGGKYLLSDLYPRHFRMDIEKRLRMRGIDIIFNDKVEGRPVLQPGMPLKTQKGTLVKCDLLVTARGAGPNTSFLQTLEPAVLTDRGYVKVLPSLQLQSHPSIFALGDVADLQEVKQFQKTAGHASVVVPNVLSYLEEEELKQEYKPGKEVIIVSNGRNGGATYFGVLWGMTFGDHFTKVAKSKDLLVGMSPSTSPQWHAIRPWTPSLSLAVREITSVSVTFILTSTVSDLEIDPNLASRGLIAAAEEEEDQESASNKPVASSSAISSSSSCINEELKSRSFIANTLAKGLSVTVNGSPWPRAFIRIDDQSGEAVIIIYALMPGRQYDVELALIPNGQSNNNNTTTTNLNKQITTEDESDNALSEIQTDPESPNLGHSTPPDPHSTPSTSPSRTVPGTPTTAPQITLEEKLNNLQQNLTAVNAEREALLASLKSARKDSQKADSALRSEIDTLKRSSERHALVESRGKQKVLALQEMVKRAQITTKEIEEKVKELQEEVPGLNEKVDEKEKEYESLKKEAEKVRKEREALEEKEKKKDEMMKADLAGLTVKLEKLGVKKERLETGFLPELEHKLKEIEKEIEVEEQNLLKLESERNANAQSQYQHYQLLQQQQQRQRQRNYHSQNHSEDFPSSPSVPIQRPRHSSELPTPIGRPILAPIQRPTQSDLGFSNLGYSAAGSNIWSQQHSHHPQIPQRSPLSAAAQTQPTFSPQLHQLHNPRSLSFHSSMMASAAGGNSVQRRSSLKNPVSVPFSPTNHFASSSGSNTPVSPSKSVSSSPTRSSASIVASTSTLSSKAPAFEPTRSMSVSTRLSSAIVIKDPNGNVIPNKTNDSNASTTREANNTSPLTAKGKTSAVSLPSPIQRPVGRVMSGDNGSGSANGGQMQGHSRQWGSCYGGGR